MPRPPSRPVLWAVLAVLAAAALLSLKLSGVSASASEVAPPDGVSAGLAELRSASPPGFEGTEQRVSEAEGDEQAEGATGEEFKAASVYAFAEREAQQEGTPPSAAASLTLDSDGSTSFTENAFPETEAAEGEEELEVSTRGSPPLALVHLSLADSTQTEGAVAGQAFAGIVKITDLSGGELSGSDGLRRVSFSLERVADDASAAFPPSPRGTGLWGPSEVDVSGGTLRQKRILSERASGLPLHFCSCAGERS